jgi:hypothetical protein
MKKERKAEVETMMTAILHSCCIQNTSQTMSTELAPTLIPAILTMATIAITSERQRKKARPSFWHRFMRTFQRRAMGKDITRISVTKSITVVMEVSRIVLLLAEDPERADEQVSAPSATE